MKLKLKTNVYETINVDEILKQQKLKTNTNYIITNFKARSLLFEIYERFLPIRHLHQNP